MKPVSIFTIGHSNHPFEHFLSLLKMHEIEVVADVRSFPVSRLPWFSKGEITKRLDENGLGYEFLGRELGGRDWGDLTFEDIIASQRFQSGLVRLAAMAVSRRVCLMCSEAEASRCHRTRLIAPAISAATTVLHIAPNGDLKSHVAKQMQLLLL